jgi:hypothetical protein
MKITNNQSYLVTTPKKIVDVPVSSQTINEFPDLTDKYDPPIPGHLDTLGHVTPVNDQAYIDRHTKELKSELKDLNHDIKTSYKMKIIGGALATAGIITAVFVSPVVALTSGLTATLMSAACLSAIGAISVGTGIVMANKASDNILKEGHEYYDKRIELDHIKRGEEWTPVRSPIYIAPSPEDEAVSTVSTVMYPEE